MCSYKWVRKEALSIEGLIIAILWEKNSSLGITAATRESVSLEFQSNTNTRIPYILKKIYTNKEGVPNQEDQSFVEMTGFMYFPKENNMTVLFYGPPAYCSFQVKHIPEYAVDPCMRCKPWHLHVAYMNSYRYVEFPEFARRIHNMYSLLNTDYDFSPEAAREIMKTKSCCDQCKSKTIGVKTLLCSHCRVAVYCSKGCQV